MYLTKNTRIQILCTIFCVSFYIPSIIICYYYYFFKKNLAILYLGSDR